MEKVKVKFFKKIGSVITPEFEALVDLPFGPRPGDEIISGGNGYIVRNNLFQISKTNSKCGVTVNAVRETNVGQ